MSNHHSIYTPDVLSILSKALTNMLAVKPEETVNQEISYRDSETRNDSFALQKCIVPKLS